MSRTPRQRIEGAASDLLARDGYNAMGLKALSTSSRLPYGSIYHHFPGGKEDIAVAAIEMTGTLVSELLTSLFARGVTPKAVRAMFAFMADRLEQSEWTMGCSVGTPALDGSSESERVRDSCAAAFAAMFVPLTDALVVHGLKRGPARDLATAIMAAYEGATLLAKTQRSRQPLVATSEAMIRLLSVTLPDG